MPVPAARVRLLVVDDDARYCRLLPELLETVADVECCGSAATALQALQGSGFDWVLLDVGLPDADGFELLGHLRRDFPALRVVLHTGLALPDGRRRAIEAGAIDLLEKPLPVSYLTDLLRRRARRVAGGGSPPPRG